MSYQVIARKWRPSRFSDMVGQEHIARTLKNAIKSGRIAHAYLLVGPRGIGKTTTARIFAKALNCEHPVDGEPCCECASCRSIADESNVDVIEVDAATYTSVDKAREICEDVWHLPISSKYKIYIIDEVHMLSKNAWNALLKTIEEPPPHAKFIFATTEVNKVLPTVISRCQRFDLRRILAKDIAARLRLICDTEHVKISDAAIQVIAQAADGGMRDAQSLLDQLISFFGQEESGITEEQALSLFGLTAPEEMRALVTAIIGNNREAVLKTVHKFAVQSKNLEALFDELLVWLRGIMLACILPDPGEVLEESAEKISTFCKIAPTTNQAVLQRLIESLSSGAYLLRDAINKQVFLESILLKAMRIAHAPQIADLIARLNQIRNTGELAPLESVVPLYEVPSARIVTTRSSRFAVPSIPPVPVADLEKPIVIPDTPVAVPPAMPVPAADAAPAADNAEPRENPVTEEAPAEPENVEEIKPEDAAQPVADDVPTAAEEAPAEPENVEEIKPEDVTQSVADDVPTAAEEAPAEPENVEEIKPEDVTQSVADDVPTAAEEVPAEPENVEEIKPEDVAQPVADDVPTAAEEVPAEVENVEEIKPEDVIPSEPAAPAAPVEAAPEDDVKPAERPIVDPYEEDLKMQASELWDRLKLEMRDVLRKDLLAKAMEDGKPQSFDGTALVIAYDATYEKELATIVRTGLKLLNDRLASMTLNREAAVRLEMLPNLIKPAKRKKIFDLEEMKNEVKQEPLIQDALDLFAGYLADVHDKDEKTD